MQQHYAQQYRDLWRRHWWWRSRRRFVLSRVQHIAQRAPIRRIFDIGCGDGLMFDDLKQFGEPWGLEPDAGLLSDDGPHRDRIEVGALDDGFQCEHTFDLVLMLDVLEHIEDDVAALDRVWALLNPGGHLLLTVPALRMLWSQHDEANRHFRRYRRGALRQRLRRAGFDVQQTGYYFGWTVGPMLLRSVLRPAPNGTENGKDEGEYAVAIPPAPVNAAMFAASRFEHYLTPAAGLPIGSSLFAVASRPR